MILALALHSVAVSAQSSDLSGPENSEVTLPAFDSYGAIEFLERVKGHIAERKKKLEEMNAQQLARMNSYKLEAEGLEEAHKAHKRRFYFYFLAAAIPTSALTLSTLLEGYPYGGLSGAVLGIMFPIIFTPVLDDSGFQRWFMPDLPSDPIDKRDLSYQLVGISRAFFELQPSDFHTYAFLLRSKLEVLDQLRGQWLKQYSDLAESKEFSIYEVAKGHSAKWEGLNLINTTESDLLERFVEMAEKQLAKGYQVYANEEQIREGCLSEVKQLVSAPIRTGE